MKEITRIHIAKVAYDIEIEAKKDLEHYLETVKNVTVDQEVVDDVEIRITEILAEHGVTSGGVVTATEIQAIKEQLGAPQEFGDGESRPTADEAYDKIRPRLFRDTDNAVLGGVLSGIAAYFKIDAVWVRLLFLVLLIGSFGMALIIYLVLWMVIPEAKTSADKLLMAGRPVTIASLREMNELEAQSAKDRPARLAGRIVTFILGLGAMSAAVASLAFTVYVTFGVTFYEGTHVNSSDPMFGFWLAAFILAIVSGLLLAVLCAQIAIALFRQKATKRSLVSMGVVTLAGTLSFVVAIGLVLFAEVQQTNLQNAHTREVSLAIPAEAKKVTSLVVEVPRGTEVHYMTAKSQAPSAKLQTIAATNSAIIKPEIKVEGDVLKISSKVSPQPVCSPFDCEGVTTATIYVYGPELKHITTKENAALQYGGPNQHALTLDAAKNSDITLHDATIEQLKVTSQEGVNIMAAAATVSNLETTATGSLLEFGTIHTLKITDQQACPAGSESTIGLEDISSGTFVWNGQTKVADNTRLGCTNVSIEKELNEEL
ncbi:MAG TPA: PspC domain-containing protein [Verrucomicrobiae bacterium]|nr:PspC domain-containing protein [Verrucomicrobiae bacterium]